MFKIKKVMLMLLVATVFVCAFAISAQYASRWYGSGDGSTSPPIPTPTPVVIYPFHEWLGDINDGEFFGAWIDDDHGDYGEFRGKVAGLTPTTARCKGDWTWLGPKDHIKMGSFEVIFDFANKTCEGTWLNIHNQDSGGIKGIRLE